MEKELIVSSSNEEKVELETDQKIKQYLKWKRNNKVKIEKKILRQVEG